MTLCYHYRVDLVRHLRYFLAVADELSFGGAARRMGVAQPQLSQRIQRLEAELGVRVFDRSRRQIVLTPEGAALVGEARQIVERADQLKHRIAQSSDVSVLRVGIPRYLEPRAVAKSMTDFENAGSVRLDVRAGSPAERAGLLSSGALDVALVAAPSVTDESACISIELGIIELEPAAVAVTAPRRWHPSDLTAMRVLLPAEYGGDTGPNGVRAELHRRGLVLQTPSADEDLDLLVTLVVAGRGVLLSDVVTASRHGLNWQPFIGDPLLYHSRLAWADSRLQSRMGEHLDRAIRSMLPPMARQKSVNYGSQGWGL